MLSKLVLAVVATLVMVLALEGLVRVADLGVHDMLAEMTRYGAIIEQDAGGYPRHLRNAHFRSEGVLMTFNSLGMRDAEPVLPKPAGTQRVLLLGDSVVVGPRVPQEAIASARLRALLAPHGIDVVTGAVSGWNTAFQEMFVATNVERLAPDVIVLVYVENDNEPLLPFDRARQPPKTLRQRLYRFLIVNSRLFEWGVYVYYQRNPDWAGLSEMAERDKVKAQAGEPYAPTERGWIESRDALHGIAAAAARHGATFAIVLFRYDRSDLTDRVLARLTEFGGASGVPVVDAMPWYRGEDAASFFVAPFDRHPNAEGHERLARGIATLLQPRRPTPSPPSGHRPGLTDPAARPPRPGPR